jgi:two-component system NtrC family sensor kinase
MNAIDNEGRGIGAVPTASFFEGSPIATFVINAQHVVTHFNKACALNLGVDPKLVIGTRDMGRILYGYDRPVLADLIIDGAMADGSLQSLYRDCCQASATIPGAYQAEGFFPDIGPNGLWLAFTAAPLHDQHGVIVGAIETLQDISEGKRIEEQLRQVQEALSQQLTVAQERLVQSERLSSIGQLAAGVAHEINNPIGYIFSNFGTLEKYLGAVFEMLNAYEMAEASHPHPESVADLQALRLRIELDYLKEDIPALMRESKEGIERVRKIVKDLKDFSHVDATLDWQYADLGRCIESTLNVVANEIKYKADVIRSLAELPEVQCHESEINQVIMNLLVNAAQAIGPERGTITIRNGTDGSLVWVEISDTGCGIEKTSMARIFDPFYTTKPVGKGTGLGLSISYGIVQKHHGQIHVRSEIGKGTTFRVELPIVQPAPQQVAAASQSSAT